MVIAGLLVMAFLLTAAAWVMRPATSEGSVARTNGHARWSPRVSELFDHMRDTGRRFARRNGGNGNGYEPVAAPHIDRSTTDQQLAGFDLHSVAQFGIRF